MAATCHMQDAICQIHFVEPFCRAICGSASEWARGTHRRCISDSARSADCCRCRVVDRDSLRRAGWATCQYFRHGCHDHHRRRARRVECRCVRQGDREGRPDDHSVVGRFAVAVPQSGGCLGGRIGAPRRGRQAATACPPGNTPFGIGHRQAADCQTTRRRAEAVEEAAGS
jgi:hypothetical protein